MPDLVALQQLAMALALGLLVGLERGWSARAEPAGSRVAGIRTFGLLGLVGGLAGLVWQRFDGLGAAIVLAAAAAAIIAGYVRDMARGDSVSATTSIAALATLAIGLITASGAPVLAAATTGVMVLLLAMREELHAWIGGLNAAEMKAIARFALVAIVVWPLLPDADYGPYDAWNPRRIWSVVVLITGLSLAGYVAAKRLGAVRGVLVTAIAGALVSSTAVTAALARRLREGDAAPPLVAGVAAAGVVMMLRTLALTALLAPFALAGLAAVVAPAALVAAIMTALALSRDHASASAAAAVPRNPFDILPALGFAALLAVAALFAHWAADRYGDEGIAVVIALTGAFDVDAAVVTLGGLPAGSLDPWLAGLVLAVPILLNTAFKAAVALGLAGWRRGRGAASALVASFAGGLAALSAASTSYW